MCGHRVNVESKWIASRCTGADHKHLWPKVTCEQSLAHRPTRPCCDPIRSSGRSGRPIPSTLRSLRGRSRAVQALHEPLFSLRLKSQAAWLGCQAATARAIAISKSYRSARTAPEVHIDAAERSIDRSTVARRQKSGSREHGDRPARSGTITTALDLEEPSRCYTVLHRSKVCPQCVSMHSNDISHNIGP